MIGYIRIREDKDRDMCLECHRDVANAHDEGVHNTGECGCEEARQLCWKTWNENKCRSLSPYDRDYQE